MAAVMFTFVESATLDNRKNKIRASGIQNMLDVLSGKVTVSGTTEKTSTQKRFETACSAVSLGNVTGIEFHAALWLSIIEDKTVNDKESVFAARVSAAIMAKAGTLDTPKPDTVRNAMQAGAYAGELFAAKKLGVYDPALKLHIGKRIIAGDTLDGAIKNHEKAMAEKASRGKAAGKGKETTGDKPGVAPGANDADKVKQAEARAANAEKATGRAMQTISAAQAAIQEACGTLGNDTIPAELRIKTAMELLAAFLPAKAK